MQSKSNIDNNAAAKNSTARHERLPRSDPSSGSDMATARILPSALIFGSHTARCAGVQFFVKYESTTSFPRLIENEPTSMYSALSTRR